MTAEQKLEKCKELVRTMTIQELQSELNRRQDEAREQRRREVRQKKDAIEKATGAHVYWSDDYAGGQIGEYKFYYGYEVTSGEDDWCFRVMKGDVTVMLKTWQELGVDKYDVINNLLMGLMVWVGAQDDPK